MKKSSWLGYAGLLLVAGSVRADEGMINVNDVARQRAPVALVAADGTARVLWENARLGILTRVVPMRDPTSASTEEKILLANTSLPSIPFEGVVVTNRQPVALSDGSGGFWLLWIRQRDYLKVEPFWENRRVLSQEVRKLRFNQSGEPVGTESVVAWASGAMKSQVTAAQTPDGSFAVAWTSSDDDDSTNGREGVFVRWFDRDGTPFGPATRVSSAGDSDRARWPSLTVGATGRLLVLWHAPDGSYTGVFARLYDANREPIDVPQRINLDTLGEQKRPSAAALDGGGYLVTWEGTRDGTLRTRIYLQTLDAAGHPAGAERPISSERHSYEMGPAIARTPRGSYFASWVVWDSSSPRDMRGVEINAEGALVGNELQLNSCRLNTQYRAMIFGTPATGLFSVWEGFMDRRDGINGLALDFLD
jgi:hypothetical protein